MVFHTASHSKNRWKSRYQQATIQVWDCDDSLSLHEIGRRNESKQVKEEQNWRRKTKKWEKIVKCEEIGLSEKSGKKGSKNVQSLK